MSARHPVVPEGRSELMFTEVLPDDDNTPPPTTTPLGQMVVPLDWAFAAAVNTLVLIVKVAVPRFTHIA
jgi:hypothetical protein